MLRKCLKMSQKCFKCPKNASKYTSKMLQKRFKNASKTLQICYKNAPKTSKKGSKIPNLGILTVFQTLSCQISSLLGVLLCF